MAGRPRFGVRLPFHLPLCLPANWPTSTLLSVLLALTSAFADDGPATTIFTWGLNNTAGRLGVGGTEKVVVAMHVYNPVEVELPLRELGLEAEGGGGWDLGEVECGMDALWVELVEEEVDHVE